MKTQYVTDGVLVRPFEQTATRFLSSRFYDGRKIVDLLESTESAQLWFEVMAREIDVVDVGTVTEAQLADLRSARDLVSTVYEAAVSGDFQNAADGLTRLGKSVTVEPSFACTGAGVDVHFSAGESAIDDFLSELLFSTADAVTPPNLSRLRKCDGPHCVLYYTQLRDGQQWCSNTCGNRARVARHARR